MGLVSIPQQRRTDDQDDEAACRCRPQSPMDEHDRHIEQHDVQAIETQAHVGPQELQRPIKDGGQHRVQPEVAFVGGAVVAERPATGIMLLARPLRPRLDIFDELLAHAVRGIGRAVFRPGEEHHVESRAIAHALPDAEPPQADRAEQAEHDGGVDGVPAKVGDAGGIWWNVRGHGGSACLRLSPSILAKRTRKCSRRAEGPVVHSAKGAALVSK